MNYYSCKISITLPQDVLNQLDAVAVSKGLSRSNAIRMSVLYWINNDTSMMRVADRANGKTGLTRAEELARFMTAKQISELDRFKNDEIDFETFLKQISNEVYFELLRLGAL